MAKRHKDSTLATAGRGKDRTFGAINPPVFHASTVLFDNYADLREGVKHSETRFFYGRKGSPTIWAFNDAMNELEGGAEAKSFPSGIAAVTASLLSVLSSDDHLLMADCVYEPTRLIAYGLLKKLGIEVEFFDPRIRAVVLFRELLGRKVGAKDGGSIRHPRTRILCIRWPLGQFIIRSKTGRLSVTYRK